MKAQRTSKATTAVKKSEELLARLTRLVTVYDDLNEMGIILVGDNGIHDAIVDTAFQYGRLADGRKGQPKD
jgi:hypothetical protein